MKKAHLLKKICRHFVLYLILFLILQSTVLPQENQTVLGDSSKPVMQSVFWNTVWGSAWGGVIGVSYFWFSGTQFRNTVITTTTVGGMVGYGLGIYLVLNGLTFDKNYLLELPKPQFGPQPNASLWNEDQSFLHARKNHRKQPNFKWEATLFQFRF